MRPRWAELPGGQGNPRRCHNAAVHGPPRTVVTILRAARAPPYPAHTFSTLPVDWARCCLHPSDSPIRETGKTMSIFFNHTIIAAKDREASAQFYVEIA